MHLSAAIFEEKAGFPGVIGCIDGTHIEIRKPEVDGDVYINRNNYATLILQGIANDK